MYVKSILNSGVLQLYILNSKNLNHSFFLLSVTIFFICLGSLTLVDPVENCGHLYAFQNVCELSYGEIYSHKLADLIPIGNVHKSPGCCSSQADFYFLLCWVTEDYDRLHSLQHLALIPFQNYAFLISRVNTLKILRI